MNYLKQASENYNCDHDGLIRPISQIDGEIIEHLLSVLSSRGVCKDVVDILSEWKKDQDGHILNKMSLCSMDEESGSAYRMLDIEGHLIDLSELRYVYPSSEWRRDRRVYLIIINPENFVHAKSLTKNIEIEFYLEEDRNKCLYGLKKELENEHNVVFGKIN